MAGFVNSVKPEIVWRFVIANNLRYIVNSGIPRIKVCIIEHSLAPYISRVIDAIKPNFSTRCAYNNIVLAIVVENGQTLLKNILKACNAVTLHKINA
jgi:hypothetical protein